MAKTKSEGKSVEPTSTNSVDETTSNSTSHIIKNKDGESIIQPRRRVSLKGWGWGAMKKNVDFGYLIPVKSCFWREIFAILRGHLSLRGIFWSFSYKSFRNLSNNLSSLGEGCALTLGSDVPLVPVERLSSFKSVFSSKPIQYSKPVVIHKILGLS